MHDVQEFGDSLHFVEYHGLASRSSSDDVVESFRSCGEFTRDVGLQQIHNQGIRDRLAEPRGFSRSARTEQKEALLRGIEKSTLKSIVGLKMEIAIPF